MATWQQLPSRGRLPGAPAACSRLRRTLGLLPTRRAVHAARAAPPQYCVNISAPFIVEVPPFKKVLSDLIPYVDFLVRPGGAKS